MPDNSADTKDLVYSYTIKNLYNNNDVRIYIEFLTQNNKKFNAYTFSEDGIKDIIFSDIFKRYSFSRIINNNLKDTSTAGIVKFSEKLSSYILYILKALAIFTTIHICILKNNINSIITSNAEYTIVKSDFDNIYGASIIVSLLQNKSVVETHAIYCTTYSMYVFDTEDNYSKYYIAEEVFLNSTNYSLEQSAITPTTVQERCFEDISLIKLTKENFGNYLDHVFLGVPFKIV